MYLKSYCSITILQKYIMVMVNLILSIGMFSAATPLEQTSNLMSKSKEIISTPNITFTTSTMTALPIHVDQICNCVIFYLCDPLDVIENTDITL